MIFEHLFCLHPQLRNHFIVLYVGCFLKAGTELKKGLVARSLPEVTLSQAEGDKITVLNIKKNYKLLLTSAVLWLY